MYINSVAIICTNYKQELEISISSLLCVLHFTRNMSKVECISLMVFIFISLIIIWMFLSLLNREGEIIVSWLPNKCVKFKPQVLFFEVQHISSCPHPPMINSIIKLLLQNWTLTVLKGLYNFWYFKLNVFRSPRHFLKNILHRQRKL